MRPAAAAAIAWGGPRGVTLSSTFRSYTEQLNLWNNRARNPYPVAPPGRSYHQLGRAFDLNGPEPVLRAIGAWWRAIGGTWSETDIIHFQA